MKPEYIESLNVSAPLITLVFVILSSLIISNSISIAWGKMFRSYKFSKKMFKEILHKLNNIPYDELVICWVAAHISVFEHYFLYLSMCEFGELPKLLSDGLWRPSSSSLSAERTVSFAQFKTLFMVPKVKKIHESENRIKKYQLLEAFINFLLQLLCHKTDPIIRLCEDRIEKLEKELKFLHSILGNASLMLCADDELEEFKKLLAEIEAVANEAGSLFHSLFFLTDRAKFEKMNESIGVVLDHIDLLKPNIEKFLNLLPSISRSTADTTARTSVDSSLLIVNSLIYDLEDLINREDNSIADGKDQVKTLHQWLILIQSSIKHIRSPQLSEIGELKEPLMLIGDMAREAQYLIISFLAGDAPLWYLINRLTNINHKIELVGTELLEITKKYKIEGLKAAEYFNPQLLLQAKRNTEADDLTVSLEDKATVILGQLVGGTERQQVISIFGMPGLGKTTLAKKLYNDPLVNCRFDRIAWCVVSQKYQMQSIMANILIQIETKLDRQKVSNKREENPVSELDRQEVSNKGKENLLDELVEYLFKEKESSEDYIFNMISKETEENLVDRIFKTLKGRRYLIVMDDIWDSNVWDDLRKSFPDDGNGSRILFTTRNKEVAPPNGIIYALPFLTNDQCWELLEKKVFENNPCPPELLGVGKEIAVNCGGLPLAVVVIAGILSTIDKEESTWEEVGGNLTSYIFDGRDNSVMRILELSYKHLPGHLRPCFLYFGAFHEDEEIPVRELKRLWIAEGFIRKEKKKNIENVAEEYLMELIDKSLVMVAKRRSDGGVKTCILHDLLRDLCLKTCEEEKYMKFLTSKYYPIYDRSHGREAFQYSVTWSYCQYMSSFCDHTMMSPLSVHDMRLLRVLYFYSSSIYLTGIEFLVCLKYLVIRDLPPSIGSLVNLEYLRVETDGIVYLSSTVMEMKKLRCIQVPMGARYQKRWKTFQRNNLESLSGIIIRELKDEKMLRCSPQLRRLKCDHLNRVCTHFDLSFLAQLDSLNLRFYEPQLTEISLPSNIRKMTLSGCNLSWERMSIIGRLENLEILKLRFHAFVGKKWDTRGGEFQKLRFLKLQDMYLTEWNVGSSQHFPRLQRLILSDCSNLQEIPYDIGEIAALQLIEVQGICTKSLLESARRIQQEQCEDMGYEELSVIFTRLLCD